MKNKIIILLILLVPLSLFIFMEQFTKNNSNIADADEYLGKVKLIKFYSPMCSECKDVGRNVENVLKNYDEEIIIFEEINAGKTDPKTKKMISKYKVTVVPTLIFVDKTGKVYKKSEGMIEEEQIKEFLDNIK